MPVRFKLEASSWRPRCITKCMSGHNSRSPSGSIFKMLGVVRSLTNQISAAKAVRPQNQTIPDRHQRRRSDDFGAGLWPL